MWIRILVAVAFCSVAFAADIIPSDRKITWQGNVGVSNGIPDVDGLTIYTNLSFPISSATLLTHLLNCPANQVVQLPAGTNSTVFTSQIDWLGVADGVVLRGAGMGQTVLQWSGFSQTSMYMRGVPYSEPPFSVEANLSTDATQGAYTLELASVPSWVTVGDLIGVDEIDDGLHSSGSGGFNLRAVLGNGERNISQVNRVLAKTATTITVELPNSWPWDTSRTAQIFQPGYDPSSSDPAIGWGVADLTLRYTFTGGSDAHPIILYVADECFFKNVEIDNMPSGRGIFTYYSFRCTFTGLHIHDSHNYGAGQGYGLDLNDSTTGCIVEDSLFDNLHVGVTVRYGSGGNAVVHNAFIEGSNASAQTASYSHHGVCSFYNLVEGNYLEPKILGDNTHGSSSLNTVFRNRARGIALGGYDTVGVSLEYFNRFWNVVGNIIGVNGQHNKFVSHQGDQTAGSQGNIFKIGGQVHVNSWYDENPDGVPAPYDAYQYTNGSYVLIHANYDFVNDAVTFNNPPGQSISETNLVNSYYLTAAPTYFTNGSGGSQLTWPLYNPYSSGTFTNYPPVYYRLVLGITNYGVGESQGGGEGSTSGSGKGRGTKGTQGRGRMR